MIESKGQLDYVNEIKEEMNDISQVTKGNIDIVDKYTSSVNELVMYAESLEEEVGRFNY